MGHPLHVPASSCARVSGSTISPVGPALVAGSDLAVMLLSLFVPAEGFGDPTEPVVQGVDVLFVVGLEQRVRSQKAVTKTRVLVRICELAEAKHLR